MADDELPSFQLVAGNVALDFANTLDNRFVPDRTIDLIATTFDFFQFCVQAGVLSGAEAQALSRHAGRKACAPEVINLREGLYRIFQRVAGKKSVAASDLDLLTRWLREGAQHRELVCIGPAQFQRKWHDIQKSPLSPLWLIADAGAELLLSESAHRIRECAQDSCRWLFLDTSKSHSRRWCDMKLCGNRVKARKHYQRGRDQQAAPE